MSGGQKRKRSADAQSFNDRMHPRNKYLHNPPNILKMTERNPELSKYVTFSKDKTKAYIDWNDNKAVVNFTKYLLKDDFDLEWSLETQQCTNVPLCPSVTRSLNYIHWVEDLIQFAWKSSIVARRKLGNMIQLRGIDIGTGASCIYPLLGTSLNPGWTFVATELNPNSTTIATSNVERNPRIMENVNVIQVSQHDYVYTAIRKDSMFWHSHPESNCYSFLVCNPPFFINKADAVLRSSEEGTGYGGYDSELYFQCNDDKTLGGEVEFVKRLIDESCASESMKQAVVWYTCMLGRKSSISGTKTYLETKCPDANVQTTTLYQGKTLRWAIAWSFIAQIPKQSHASLSTADKSCNKLSTRFEIHEEGLLESEVKLRISQAIKTFLQHKKRLEQFGTVNCIDEPLDKVLETKSSVWVRYRFEEFAHKQVLGFCNVNIQCNKDLSNVTLELHPLEKVHEINPTSLLMSLAQFLPSDCCRTSRFWRRKMKSNT